MNVITPPLLLPSSWPPGGGEALLAFAHRLHLLSSSPLEAKLDGCSLQEEGNYTYNAFSNQRLDLGVKHLSPTWHNLSPSVSSISEQPALT